MCVEFFITHGMLGRMWESIGTDWLEKGGEILFNLKRWGGSYLKMRYWKREHVARVPLHRDVVLDCCSATGKDVVAKHIRQCFQLACDLPRALDAGDQHADASEQYGGTRSVT